MDPKGQSLLKLLFNPGEEICVSNNEFGYYSVPLEKALDGKITLISPNEKTIQKECDSYDLIMVALNPIKGWRRDEFVTAYRTFLVEIDFGSIKEQQATLKHVKMPHSAQIFSGNKSLHTLIILNEDIKDEKTYRYLGQWILNILTFADQNIKNPSRSTRIPGAYRESGKKQRLLNIGKRIGHKELMDWLKKYEHLRPQVKEKRVLTGQPDYDKLSKWAKGQLKYGIRPTKGRNQTWYGLFCDFALAGYSEDEAINALAPHFVEERDFREKEWLIIAKSAFNRK